MAKAIEASDAYDAQFGALTGPNSVNTMAEATIAAFEDHGTVSRTLDMGGVDAFHQSFAHVLTETFVIKGAGLTCAKAAAALRTQGFGGKVVLIGDRGRPSRHRD